jgi:hypothetical protein
MVQKCFIMAQQICFITAHYLALELQRKHAVYVVSRVYRSGTIRGYALDMKTIYWARSHKSSVRVPLKAKTLLGAKREAWAWITERYCGVTVMVRTIHENENSVFQAIAAKPVCPITGKVEKWKEV